MNRLSLLAVFLFGAGLFHSPIAFAMEIASRPATEIAQNERATPYFMYEKYRLAEQAVSIPSECQSCGVTNQCGEGDHCLNGCCQPTENHCVSDDQCAPGICDGGRCTNPQ